jgi:ABC-type glycerol-3-phosphate transport system permease component
MAVTSSSISSTRRARRTAQLACLGERALAAVAALIWLAVVLIPLAYAVIQTFKPQQDELTTSPWSIPHFTFANYAGVITPVFLRCVLNSVVTLVGAVLLSTLLGSLAAYALARVPGRINGLLYLLFVSGLAVPIYAAITPIYRFSSDVTHPPAGLQLAPAAAGGHVVVTTSTPSPRRPSARTPRPSTQPAGSATLSSARCTAATNSGCGSGSGHSAGGGGSVGSRG